MPARATARLCAGWTPTRPCNAYALSRACVPPSYGQTDRRRIVQGRRPRPEAHDRRPGVLRRAAPVLGPARPSAGCPAGRLSACSGLRLWSCRTLQALQRVHEALQPADVLGELDNITTALAAVAPSKVLAFVDDEARRPVVMAGKRTMGLPLTSARRSELTGEQVTTKALDGPGALDGPYAVLYCVIGRWPRWS